MKRTPIPEIRASGFIKLTMGDDSVILVCENSIKATLAEEKRDITPSHIGKAGAVTTAVTADIEFTPVKFSDIDILFAVLAAPRGAPLSDYAVSADIYCQIAANAWKHFSFPRCEWDSIGGITFGASNAPLGAFKIKAYPDPLADGAVSAKIFTVEDLAAAPALPAALASSDIFAIRPIAVYGSGADAKSFDMKTASIEISLSTSDIDNVRLGKTGKMLDDIDVTFKCAPLLSYEDWLAVTGIDAHNDVGAYVGVGTLKQILFRDPKAGGYGFTGLSAQIENPSATFGAKESLIGEVSFKPLGDTMGDNKLAIAPIADAFAFETAPLVAAHFKTPDLSDGAAV